MKNPFKKDKQTLYKEGKDLAESLYNIVKRDNRMVIVYGCYKVVISTAEDGKEAGKLLNRLNELRDAYIEEYMARNGRL